MVENVGNSVGIFGLLKARNVVVVAAVIVLGYLTQEQLGGKMLKSFHEVNAERTEVSKSCCSDEGHYNALVAVDYDDADDGVEDDDMNFAEVE